MLGPMFPLAIGVAILDKHTRHTCLETDTLSCHAAAIGTADVVDVHEELKRGTRDEAPHAHSQCFPTRGMIRTGGGIIAAIPVQQVSIIC